MGYTPLPAPKKTTIVYSEDAIRVYTPDGKGAAISAEGLYELIIEHSQQSITKQKGHWRGRQMVTKLFNFIKRTGMKKLL